MVWLVPAALSGLVLLAGPAIVHLFSRRRARQIAFPTLRFVREARSTSVRLQRPSDLPLLAVRLAGVAAAVAAAAHPVIVTAPRIAHWNARVARAIVVDTSPSMRRADATGQLPADLAAGAVRAEERTAFASVRVDTASLADGVERAMRQLDLLPPARREILVVSDFQAGTLDRSRLSLVPGHIGLRMVRVGLRQRTASWTAGNGTSWRGARWTETVAIDDVSTTSTWTRSSGAPAAGAVTVLAASADQDAARVALGAAESLGTASSATHHVVVRFSGAPNAERFARAERVRTGWIVDATNRLMSSDEIVEALRRDRVDGSASPLDERWTPAARDSSARPTVWVAENAGVLLVETTAKAGTPVAAAALLRDIVLAAGESAGRDEEVRVIPDAELARWRREPGPVTREMWRRAEPSDARWFWAAALVLLAFESWLRRSDRQAAEEPSDARAA
jgi:hypothetical protein